MPALLMRISIPPKASAAIDVAEMISFSTAESAIIANAPVSEESFLAASAEFLYVKATLYPRSAKACTIALPIPRLPPVISTFFMVLPPLL